MNKLIFDYIELLNNNGFEIAYEYKNFSNFKNIKNKNLNKIICFLEYGELKLYILKLNIEKSNYLIMLDEILCKEINFKDVTFENDYMNKIFDFTNSISVDPDFKNTGEKLLESLVKNLDFKGGLFFSYDEQNKLNLLYSTGEALKLSESFFKINKNTFDTAIELKKPILMDFSANNVFFNFSSANISLRNILINPIFSKEEVYGFIVLINKNFCVLKDLFTMLNTSEVINSIFEISIKEEKLKKMLLSTLKSLLKAQNIRIKKSPYENIRIKDLALKISDKLRLSKQDKWLLELSSYIFDVGSIGISDELFMKNNKLNEEEYETIKNHVKIGCGILENIPELPEKIKEIVLLHHEKWNGEGYPRGLMENETPILAQIIGICDVYVSMTEDRPYRKAFAKNQVINYLKEFSGIFFNPRLVNIICEVV